jgi:predicted nucleotidyltransferase
MPNLLNNLSLSTNELTAIREATSQLKAQFPVTDVILFGSVARGEAQEGSDTDLLVLTSAEVSHRTRNLMSDIIFEINFTYNTNLSIVVAEVNSWNHGIISLLNIHDEVQRDGVYL